MLENVVSNRFARAVAALLVLSLATWAVLQGSASADAGCLRAAPEALAQGGRYLLTCAFGLGMIVGGALGLGVNTFGAATAISLGLHIALGACS